MWPPEVQCLLCAILRPRWRADQCKMRGDTLHAAGQWTQAPKERFPPAHCEPAAAITAGDAQPATPLSICHAVEPRLLTLACQSHNAGYQTEFKERQ